MTEQALTVTMTDDQFSQYSEQISRHHLNIEILAVKNTENLERASAATERSVESQVAANARMLSKREAFASAALNGLLASGKFDNAGVGFEDFIVTAAYNIADAMLAAMETTMSDQG